MKYDVFISYSRSDLDKVKAIKTEIEQATGVSCWMDLEGIESGVPRFTKAIIDGIELCDVFLFMRSEQSQNSKYALLELNYANEEPEKHVVIVNIDNSRMVKEFRFLYSLTDTIDWNNQPQREKLFRDIRKWTGKFDNKAEEEAKRKAEEEARRKAEEEAKRKEEEEHQKKLKALENTKLEAIKKDGKYGFADEGKVVIPCQWMVAWPFSEGLAAVADDNWKWGFIDKTGKVVIPCQWKDARFFHEGLAAVRDDNWRYGFIDKTGKVVIPCQWKDARFFHEGLAAVEDAIGKWWKIDKTGKIVE